MATFKKAAKFKTQKRFNTEVSAAAAAPVNRDDEVRMLYGRKKEIVRVCF